MRLVLKFDGQIVQEFVLDKDNITIGRIARNDIVIDNLAISSLHAMVQNTEHGAVLEDMNSTNGTFVNDNKINLHNLKDGDVISIGKHKITFFSESAAPSVNYNSKSEDSEATVMMSADFQQQLQKELSKNKSIPTQRQNIHLKRRKKIGFWQKTKDLLGFS